MRDVVNKPIRGSYTYTFTSNKYPQYNTEKIYQTTPGAIRKGRSEISKSNHLYTTNYRAYDISIRGGEWFASKETLKRGHLKTYVYEGFVSAPSLGTVLDYIHSNSYEPLLPYGMKDRCTNKLLAEASAMDWNAAQSVAEIRTTAQMILAACVAGLRAAAFARKGNWAQAWKTVRGRGSVADNAANAYLGVQYGWRPLISDVQGLMKALDSKLRDEKLVKVKTAIVETRSVSDYRSPYDLNCSWEVGCEGGLTFSVKDPELATAASYGLLNPLLLAWEVVPLSFVIDWFIQVSSYLQGLGATLGLEFKTGYTTSFARLSKGSVTRPNIAPSDFTGEDLKWEVNAFAMKREKISSWPRPKVTIRLSLNINQLLSALALVQQRT